MQSGVAAKRRQELGEDDWEQMSRSSLVREEPGCLLQGQEQGEGRRGVSGGKRRGEWNQERNAEWLRPQRRGASASPLLSDW